MTTPNEAPRVRPRLVVARWMMAVALVLAMSACAPTKIRPVSSYVGGDTLPRPDRVLVYDFAISPEQVSLNRGLFSRLGRDVSSASVTDEELAIGREVADGFANELVKRIQLLGLPAERVDATQVAPPGTLAITGQSLSIDEGNRMRRTLIGFGAGQSEVTQAVGGGQGIFMASRRRSRSWPSVRSHVSASASGVHAPAALAVRSGAGCEYTVTSPPRTPTT